MMNGTTYTPPVLSEARASLFVELGLLRERTADNRHASLMLAGNAMRTCAASRAACQTARLARQQWRAWHAGVRAVASAPAILHDTTAPCVRVCGYCEAVHLGLSSPAFDDDWIDPPHTIRAEMRDSWRGRAITHVVCPRCAASHPELPGAATPGIDPESTSDVSQLLLDVLDALGIGIGSLDDLGDDFDDDSDTAAEPGTPSLVHDSRSRTPRRFRPRLRDR